MVQSFLKKDTMLLAGFFVITVLMVGCAVLLSLGSSESALVCGAAVLCLLGLSFTFLTIAGHLNKNAEELYGEELAHGGK